MLRSGYVGVMKKLGQNDPIFPLNGIVDLIVFIFSVWFSWHFIAMPVHDYVTEILIGQDDQPKDQQQLP